MPFIVYCQDRSGADDLRKEFWQIILPILNPS